jgi:8-oxo-dGTP pyrophosphatase MutT (NUDIX family)
MTGATVAGGHNASVLVLFRGESFETADLLLTRRSRQVATHAGQVAFPGGGVEEQDGAHPVRTALRETVEETGIPLEVIRALGVLPHFPTVSGGFRVAPVLAMLPLEHGEVLFAPDPKEVDRISWVPVRRLRETRTTETFEVHGQQVLLPVFQWENDRMWGLTALIFDSILHRYDSLFP